MWINLRSCEFPVSFAQESEHSTDTCSCSRVFEAGHALAAFQPEVAFRAFDEFVRTGTVTFASGAAPDDHGDGSGAEPGSGSGSGDDDGDNAGMRAAPSFFAVVVATAVWIAGSL